MTRPDEIHKNLSMRAALVIARELGCSVIQNEEHVIHHPTWTRAVRCKVGRHDAGGDLVSKLRKLAKSSVRPDAPTG